MAERIAANVRVVSDGTPTGTKVLTSDGVDISRMVSAVQWTHEAGDAPRVEVKMMLVPVHVDGVAKMYGPNGKTVRRIEYEDGTVDDFDAVSFHSLADDVVRKVRGRPGGAS